jgi:hypothetical protein
MGIEIADQAATPVARGHTKEKAGQSAGSFDPMATSST